MMKLRILVVFFLLSQLAISQENRSIDGFGNNKQNPEWGSAGSIMPSDASNGFNDGFSSPAGATRPNARVVSNELFDQQSDLPDERNLSEFVWVFGQFIDHDLSHVKSNFQEIIGVKVPQNDQYFQAGFQIPFARSDFAPGTGNSMDNPRKYINQISSFIDASHIYGSYENRANWMRTFEKGKLKTSSDNFLPWNTQNGEFNSPLNPLAPFMDNDIGTGGKLYVSGDQRSNENPLLLCLHTIFLREHTGYVKILQLSIRTWMMRSFISALGNLLEPIFNLLFIMNGYPLWVLICPFIMDIIKIWILGFEMNFLPQLLDWAIP